MVKNQINYLIGNKHNSRPNTRKLKNQSKINGCEIIPEEDEDIKKADQMIKKISKKLTITNQTKRFNKANVNGNNQENVNQKILLFNPKKANEPTKLLNKNLVSSKKDVPVLLFKNEKIMKDSTPSIFPLTAKQSLIQEKERKDISKLINQNIISQKPVIPSLSLKREKNINSDSTCEYTGDNNKKIVLEAKTVDELNNDRMHLISAHGYCSSMTKSNALINVPMKRPLSNFNGFGANLWEEIQEEGEIPKLDSYKNTNYKRNQCYLKYKGNKRSYSQNIRRRVDPENEIPLINSNIANQMNKYSSVNIDRNKKIHKIKVEKGMMSSKLVDTLVNKFHFDFDTQSFKKINSQVGPSLKL